MKNYIKLKTPAGIRLIGPGQPCFMVAEMSGNHGQDIKKAYKIIDSAVEAGADAVKLQTYTPDTITLDCDNKYFQVKVNDAWKGQTLYSLYKKAFTPWPWQEKLKKYGEKKGILVFSTPFDATAVDFLEKLGMAIYKIASFELIDLPLLERVGRTKKPVIISRGMASKNELAWAIKTLKNSGCPAVAVLHCVSSYPANPEGMNLATVKDIIKRFKTVSGLSDHSLGLTASLTAVILGASIIEKHLTIKRSQGGPDSAFSLEPSEFKSLVQAVRQAEQAIGRPSYGPNQSERENIVFRKSLFATADIKKGERLTPKNICSIRPGYGLAPKHYYKVMGRTAKKDIKRGTPLKWNLIK